MDTLGIAMLGFQTRNPILSHMTQSQICNSVLLCVMGYMQTLVLQVSDPKMSATGEGTTARFVMAFFFFFFMRGFSFMPS